jgi:CBS domain-containing protein
MEQNDTSYLFVVDEGKYRGIVTIQGLARTLAALGQQQ